MSGSKDKFPFQIERIYEKKREDHTTRVLVDRLWPRGIKKSEAHVDLWLKDIAPSSELRKWFGHDPAKWEEFRRRYQGELDKQGEAVDKLFELASHGPVTLLYGARDETHNQARVLYDYLEAGPKHAKAAQQ